jgi:hypothetical protein
MTDSERLLRIMTWAVDKAGGAARLGRAMTERGHPITIGAITQWREIPVRRAKVVSAITGIPLHELRPDYWDAPPAMRAAE